MGCHKLHIKQNKALVKGALGLYISYKKGCAGAYRYGFNGQEKVDEIAGVGNHNTALFWEYDTRLGRRWNVDPKPNVSISGYACFGNNPIFISDVYGDSGKVYMNYSSAGSSLPLKNDDAKKAFESGIINKLKQNGLKNAEVQRVNSKPDNMDATDQYVEWQDFSKFIYKDADGNNVKLGNNSGGFVDFDNNRDQTTYLNSTYNPTNSYSFNYDVNQMSAVAEHEILHGFDNRIKSLLIRNGLPTFPSPTDRGHYNANDNIVPGITYGFNILQSGGVILDNPKNPNFNSFGMGSIFLTSYQRPLFANWFNNGGVIKLSTVVIK